MDSQFIVEYAELAKRLNVTETARYLNMSQPTLSKHITALEKTLRFQLFERSPTGLKLTRTGIDLLPQASGDVFLWNLIEKQQAFEARAKELRANPPAPIRWRGRQRRSCHRGDGQTHRDNVAYIRGKLFRA